jgi:hypothetical protein
MMTDRLRTRRDVYMWPPPGTWQRRGALEGLASDLQRRGRRPSQRPGARYVSRLCADVPALVIGVYRSSIIDRVHLTLTAPGEPVVICMRCHTSVVVAPLTSGMPLL